MSSVNQRAECLKSTLRTLKPSVIPDPPSDPEEVRGQLTSKLHVDQWELQGQGFDTRVLEQDTELLGVKPGQQEQNKNKRCKKRVLLRSEHKTSCRTE